MDTEVRLGSDPYEIPYGDTPFTIEAYSGHLTGTMAYTITVPTGAVVADIYCDQTLWLGIAAITLPSGAPSKATLKMCPPGGAISVTVKNVTTLHLKSRLDCDVNVEFRNVGLRRTSN